MKRGLSALGIKVIVIILAIIVSVIVFGFIYFSIIAMNNLPKHCVFPNGIECNDFTFNKSTGKLVVVITNVMGNAIDKINISISGCTENIDTIHSLENGQRAQLLFDCKKSISFKLKPTVSFVVRNSTLPKKINDTHSFNTSNSWKALNDSIGIPSGDGSGGSGGSGSSTSPQPENPPINECNDTLDNDLDSLIDTFDPGCIVSITESADPIRTKTYAYLWNKQASYYYYPNGSVIPQNEILVYPDIDNFVLMYRVNDVMTPSNAEKVKNALDTMPEGHKVMIDLGQVWLLPGSDIAWGWGGKAGCWGMDPFTLQPRKYECLWWNGSNAVWNIYNSFFNRYKEINGSLDVFILDFERYKSVGEIMRLQPYANDTPETMGYTQNQVRSLYALEEFRAIQNDPRFATEIAPLLGFSNLDTVWGPSNRNTTLVEGINVRNYVIWDEVMKNIFGYYINNATYDVIANYYPDVRMSDYDWFLNNASSYWKNFCANRLRDYHAVDVEYCYGQSRIIGTHQSRRVYGSGSNDIFVSIFDDEEWIRSMMLASPTTKIHPWIINRGDSDYHQETIFHMMLLGVDEFLFYNVGVAHPKPGVSIEDANKEEILVSKAMNQFDSIAGFSDKQLLPTVNFFDHPTGHNIDYIYTGMYSGGRNVWRISLRLPNEINASSRILSQSNPVMILTLPNSTTQKLITITNASVYFPSEELSTKGVWVIGTNSSVLTVSSSP